MAVSVINTDWETAKAVEQALGLLETGEYGICRECEEPINPKRPRGNTLDRSLRRLQRSARLRPRSDPHIPARSLRLRRNGPSSVGGVPPRRVLGWNRGSHNVVAGLWRVGGGVRGRRGRATDAA